MSTTMDITLHCSVSCTIESDAKAYIDSIKHPNFWRLKISCDGQDVTFFLHSPEQLLGLSEAIRKTVDKMLNPEGTERDVTDGDDLGIAAYRERNGLVLKEVA